MKLILTKEQEREIGRQWVKEQQDVPHGYKEVLDVLFTGGQFAKWSWFDALEYSITVCSKSYCSKRDWIILNFTRTGDR